MMVQVMIQLIKHYSIIVFLNRFGLRTNAVVFLEEVPTKAAKPGRVVSSKAMHMIFNTQLTSSYLQVRILSVSNKPLCKRLVHTDKTTTGIIPKLRN